MKIFIIFLLLLLDKSLMGADSLIGFVQGETQTVQNSSLTRGKVNKNSPIEPTKTFDSYAHGSWKVPDSCTLTCPEPIKGYFYRFAGIDLQRGQISCYVYAENDYTSFILTETYTNEHCKRDFTATPNTDRYVGSEKKNFTVPYNRFKQLEDKYFNYYTNTGNQRFLTLPEYLVAGMTADNEVLNLKASIEQNDLVFQSGYTIKPNAHVEDQTQGYILRFRNWIGNKWNRLIGEENTPGSAINPTNLNGNADAYISDSITPIKYRFESSILYMINLLSDNNSLYLEVSCYALFLALPFTIMLVSFEQLSKRLQNIPNHEDIAGRVILTFGTIFIFYITGTENETTDQNKISLTNFQDWSREVIYGGIRLTNQASQGISTAYFKTKLRNVGIQPYDHLIENMRQKERTVRENKVLSGLIDKCYEQYDTDELQPFSSDLIGKNIIFPPGEYFKIRGGYNFNPYIALDPTLRRTQNVHSLSACHSYVRHFNRNKESLERLDQQIAAYKRSLSDNEMGERIEKIMEIQLRNVAELGFFALPIMSTVDALWNLQNDFVHKYDNDTIRTQLNHQYREVHEIDRNLKADDSLWINPVTWYFNLLAYKSLPVYDTVESGLIEAVCYSKTKLGWLGFLLSDDVIDTLRDDAAVQEEGQCTPKWYTKPFFSEAAAGIMEKLINALPVISFLTSSLLAISWWVMSLELFYFVSPFVVIWAFARSQMEMLTNFMIRFVGLAFKPFLIVFSIAIAIFIREQFIGLGELLSTAQFDTLFAVTSSSSGPWDQEFWLDPILITVKSYVNIAIQIFGSVLVFFIVLFAANVMMLYLGFKDAGAEFQSEVGSRIERQAGSKWTNPI